MKAFLQYLRRSLLCLLLVIGVTLLFFACVFGIIKLVNTVDSAANISSFVKLLVALLSLLFFAVSLALGIAVVYVIGRISEHDLRLKWLPMFAIAAGVFYYGFLLTYNREAVLALPGFLASFSETLLTGADVATLYCMLYGGAMLLFLIYTQMRTSVVTAIPKMLLEVAVLLIAMAACTNFNFNYHEPTPLKILTIPVMIGGMVLCFVLGIKMPYIFGRNLGGYMKPFAWLMYILGTLFALVGLALLVGVIGVKDMIYFLKDYLRRNLPSAFAPAVYLLDDLSGLVLSISLVLLGGTWAFETRVVMREPCPVCGRYAHKLVVEKSESTDSVSKPYTIREKELSSSDWIGDGWSLDHYSDQENTYQHVHYTSHDKIECRYCGADLGYESFSGSYKEQVTSTEIGKHDELHWG